MCREHPPPPPPQAATTTRPRSPPPKPPGRKTPAPLPPSHENEEKEINKDTEVIRDNSDLEQSDQEQSVKITIEDTPECSDSDEDDVDDDNVKQLGQVDKPEDPLEAGYQRSMKRLLSNIAEIPDDECEDCNESEIAVEFPEEKEGGTEENVRQDRYKVDTKERQDEEAETETENTPSFFIDSAFTLNENELNDETSEPEKFKPEEHGHNKETNLIWLKF